MTLNVSLLLDRILVRADDVKEAKSPAGLVIPESTRNTTFIGTVLLAGPGIPTEDPKVIFPNPVKPGMKVLFEPNQHHAKIILGVQCFLMRSTEIIGIVNEDVAVPESVSPIM